MSSLLHKLAGLSFMKVVFVSFCGRRVLKVVFIFLTFKYLFIFSYFCCDTIRYIETVLVPADLRTCAVDIPVFDSSSNDHILYHGHG